MSVLLAASPLIAVAVATLVARRRPIEAAGIGAGAALVLFFVWSGSAPAGIDMMVLRAFVLSLNAVAVIVPGLLFVEVSRAHGADAALGEWVRNIPVATDIKAVLLVVALGPFVGSLTGFGVSLVVIVPVALALLPREQGLRAALLSMNVMPWGTLGLATLIGAQLAGYPAATLGAATALTSSPIFPAAALLASLVAGERRPTRLALALFIGSGFSAALWALNTMIGPPIAGVLAGALTLAAIASVLVLAGRRPGLPPAAAWPYGLLFALVVILRLVVIAAPSLKEIRIIADDISWTPATSPGLSLSLAVVLAARRAEIGNQARAAMSRAAMPVATVMLFLLMSQAMVAGGLVDTMASELTGLNAGLGLVLVAVMGLGSGYMTGSTVTGNALLIIPATALGESHGAGLLFAAVQNSSAGHAVLAAMPIIALLAGLAGANAHEQARLMRFGLTVAAFNGVLIALAAWLWSVTGVL